MYFTDYLFLVFAFITLYLLVLFLILFMKNRKQMFDAVSSSRRPSVSLIIPAYNEGEQITETIKAGKNLSYPRELFEVLVVDDGSMDDTAEKAEREGVRVVRKENAGKAAALILGLNWLTGILWAA